MGRHRFHYVREIVGVEIDCTAIVGDELKIVRYYEGQGAQEVIRSLNFDQMCINGEM